MRFFYGLLVLLQAITLVSSDARCDDAARATPAAKLSPQTDFTAGLYGLYNPMAGAVFFDVLRAHPYDYSQKYNEVWSKWGYGTELVLNPAYASLGVFLEWMPALFAVIRARYDAYAYLGYFGEVLSYDSVPSGFMESDLNARAGEEEAAFGQRLMLQPTLRGQVGKVFFQNQTDASWYDTYTTGPYIFNWDYETFIEPSDFVIETRTDLMLEMQRGEGETRFLIGPSYTLTYAVRTKLRRQRAGVSVIWVPRDRVDKPGYFYLCLASGVNVEAALEEKSPYLVFVLGGAWTRR